MTKKWYILQFKSNAHHQAVKNLNQQGFETFLPLQNVTMRKTSRFINVNRPLFPGYMFVTFDIADKKWVKINHTLGVLRLITFNSRLRSVPTSFMNDLISNFDLSGKLLQEKKLEKGDQVKILNGPLANFIATVKDLEADQRISILMDLMGRETKIVTTSNNLQLSN